MTTISTQKVEDAPCSYSNDKKDSDIIFADFEDDNEGVIINDSTTEDNSLMLEIINNVETRLIQESIQKEWQKYNETKMQLKDFTFLIASLLAFITSLSIMWGSGTNNGRFIDLILSMSLVAGFFGIIIGIPISVSCSGFKKDDYKSKINTQRIELAEKMLNIEILKKKSVKITEDWDEVMALNRNGDYIKILMCVINDQETGLETIESKMLKNQ